MLMNMLMNINMFINNDNVNEQLNRFKFKFLRRFHQRRLTLISNSQNYYMYKNLNLILYLIVWCSSVH